MLLFFCVFLGTLSVHADVDGQINRIDNSSTTDDDMKSDTKTKDTVKESSPTTDPATLYDRYKNNSFELMTKEQKGLNPFKKTAGKITGVLKNFFWSWTKIQGQLNTAMVKIMFDMDIITPIKAQMIRFTSMLAKNMLSIAGTIGIGFISMVMAIKFFGEQRFKRAIGVFCMTILIFTGLVVLKDGQSSNSMVNTLFSIDKAVETQIVNVNPVLKDRPNTASDNVNTNLKSAGDTLASKIFYTNVYEPYLLLNYGKTNPDKISAKKAQYSGKDYDRINILLDNDAGTELGDKIQDKVTDYEADKLKNRTVSYTHNLDNAFFALFYALVNTIQTIVLFALCFIRIIFAVMQLFLLPILPILLIVGLFMTTMNPFKNFGKAFGMTIFMKAMAGFACILVTSFLSIGFQLAGDVDNIWAKLLTILVYLLAPLGIYYFRTFLGSMFTGQMTLQNAVGFATRPFSTQKMMRENAKDRKRQNKQTAKDEKEKRKKQKEAERKKALDAGNRDIRLKQPKEMKERKESAIRRDLKPKPAHTAPNKREQLQKNLESLHHQSKNNEAKEATEIANRRERKTLDRDAQKTGEAMAKANKQMKEKQQTTAPNAPHSEVKNSNNHSGRSTKRTQPATRSTANDVSNTAKRRAALSGRGNSSGTPIKSKQSPDNGQHQVTPSVNTVLKSSKNHARRSTTRGQQAAGASVKRRAVNGQKQPIESVNRATMTSKTPRNVSSNGGAIKRRSPHVQQKMRTVQEVTQRQVTTKANNQKNASNGSKETISPQKNVTRTLKRQAPIKGTPVTKKAKIRRKR
ncbi:hypothetical protein RV02_GL002385 [Enterococcus gilvus]|nr:hypothetical protein RV02_GL002385 [Enterococcus gilvus]